MRLASTRGSSVTAACGFVLIGGVLGVAQAAISAYWALGGTALLDTVGSSVERAGRAGGAIVIVGLWAVVALKLVAAAMPAWAIAGRTGGRDRRMAWRLTLVEATVLTGYGLVLTGAGLLIQLGIVHPGASADHRALAWHAFLWDPWFLVWGLAVAAAIHSARGAPSPPVGAHPAAPTGT
jgi:hypothetical protein